MTDALCFNCGSVKFGALCHCFTCGAPATGMINLDIAFSDHNMSRQTLEQFGAVIKALKEHTSNPEVGFWAFITYISRHHSDILKAEPPPPIAQAVHALLERAKLPGVERERWSPREEPAGDPPENLPEVTDIPLPDEWFRRFLEKHPFSVITLIDVLRTDGRVLRATLGNVLGEGHVVVDESAGLRLEDIDAIRSARGCLPWLPWRRPWVRRT